jgi:hypothetical protein
MVRLAASLRRLLHRSPAHAQYRRLARKWNAAGRPALDRSAPAVAIVHWWLTDSERRGARVHRTLRAWQLEHEAVLERMQPGWLEQYLRSRVKSAAFCTHCGAVIAPCCIDRWALPRWRSGTAICPLCGQGEIVG